MNGWVDARVDESRDREKQGQIEGLMEAGMEE